ncbi:ROK family transcriptional regulator [Actinocorallia sp. A-T 12471]|uniref:ROK family transcriptional regulator n=1 Tax=Actinocorallia sp. A-T 12471 TaxID=3089813 RepID=UPI0029D3D82F|nr:ROK family transcriptional regulator [Actinocorallia sp. A-T 12471]MDX6740496.1 ROK family transcriptional regulator [Actinocorallia sp. A-T 12471]
MRAAPSPEEIRRHNLGTLLRHVHLSGPASRAALAERMGLNRSTIMALTSDLTAAGLVTEELPKTTRKAGRPSLVVRPESDRVYVLALDVGADRLVVARVGLGGTVLDRADVVVARDSHDVDDVVSALAAAGRRLVRNAASDALCVGVGVAFSGIVRQEDGVVRHGPNIGWVDVPLGAELTRRMALGLRVSVGNDANLAALAERARGAGAGLDDIIYLHGDVGIGGGVIVGGRLLGGEGGYGGEIGHMVVNPGGRPCGCGSRGCLESEAGELALIALSGRSTEGTSGRRAVELIVDAADRGDAKARDALHQVGDWLGYGVANLINIFNPSMVIFGGVMREIYMGSAAQVRSRLAIDGLTAARESVRLRTSTLGEQATLMGAAELAFTDVLTDPLETLTKARSL